MFRSMIYTWIILLLASACCPYPHFEREAPVFDGILTRKGGPATNVRVTLSTRVMFLPGCANPKVETRTDAQGKFHLDPPQYFNPVISTGDRRDAWSLCFQFTDGLEAAWEDSDYWGGPPLQKLECQINNDVWKAGEVVKLARIESGKSAPNGCTVETIRSSSRTPTRTAPHTLTPTAFETTLAPEMQEAYRLLHAPGVFSGPAVGVAATTPDAVKALRVVLKDPAAEKIFRQLLAEATSEGQLYALAGLYVINPEYARMVAKPYQSSKKMVQTQFGCVNAGMPVSEVTQQILEGNLPRALAGTE